MSGTRTCAPEYTAVSKNAGYSTIPFSKPLGDANPAPQRHAREPAKIQTPGTAKGKYPVECYLYGFFRRSLAENGYYSDAIE